MKHPERFNIIGDKVILTSYKIEHVPKYHRWMSDEETLELTGSERLTLEEEFEMQQEWEKDANKCTFIILAKSVFDETRNEEMAMIGDTNIFLTHHNENDDDSTDVGTSTGEIEIMIAEKDYRRQGCAVEALRLMMKFGLEKLKISKFYAKIKKYNASSIALFEKLGYIFESESKVFNEICFSYVP